MIGPILFTAADGYRLETRDVTVDLRNRTLPSRGAVEGRMPLGRFTADRSSVEPARPHASCSPAARACISTRAGSDERA